MNWRLLIAVSISLIGHALAMYLLATTNHHFNDADKSAVLMVSLKKVVNPLKPELNTATPESSADNPELAPKSKSENDALNLVSANIQDSNNHEPSWFPIPEPKYYSLKELEHIPSILKNVNSDPPELLQFSQGGELTVRIWIDEIGNVVNTEIVKSNLPEEFNKSALKNFADAKFSPGIKNNLPVKTIAYITVRYASKEPVKE